MKIGVSCLCTSWFTVVGVGISLKLCCSISAKDSFISLMFVLRFFIGSMVSNTLAKFSRFDWLTGAIYALESLMLDNFSSSNGIAGLFSPEPLPKEDSEVPRAGDSLFLCVTDIFSISDSLGRPRTKLPWLSLALLSAALLALNSCISLSTSSAKDRLDFLPLSGLSGLMALKSSMFESVGSNSDLIVGM